MQGRGFHVASFSIFLICGLTAFAQTTVTTTGGTANTVPKFSSSGAVVNSAITESNGGVSINTSQPYGILTVVPPVFVQDGQSTPANGIVFADRYGTTDQWSHAAIYSMGATGYNGNLIFATDGDGVENFNPTEKMRIDPFGRVGIGTSAPGATLEVNGNLKLSNGSGGTITFPDGTVQATAAGNNGMTVGSSSNDAYIRLSNTATGGRTYLVDSGSGGAGVGAGNFAIWDETAGAARLAVAPSGYIGINTIAPHYQLDVNGNIHTSGSLVFPDGSSLSSANGLSSGGSSGSAANLPDITDSNGRVGIGTTAPRSKVDIWNGALSVTGTDMNGTAFVTSQGGTAFFGDNTVGNGLAVDPYGNVGVGTATPQTKLDVAGVINGRNYAFSNYGTPQWIQVGTFTPGIVGSTVRLTAFIHNGFNSSNLQDSTYTLLFKNSNGVSVDPNGFLGNGSWYAVGFNSSIPNGSIKWVANAPGTNATAYTLYMNLPSFAEGSHYAVTLDQTSAWVNSGATASDPGAASNTVLIPNAEFDLPYGNMGVGTVTPSAKLEVNGGIKMTAGSTGGLTFPDGTTQNTAYTAGAGSSSLNSVISVAGSNVNVGTAASQANLAVTGAISASQYTGGVFLRNNAGTTVANTNIDPRLLHEGMTSGDGSGPLPWGLNLSSLPWTWGQDPITYHAGTHFFRVAGANTNETDVMIINGAGVGIGTSPGSKLEVNGNIKLTAGSGASLTFQDGSVQTVAWNGTLSGGDYAESVDVTGDRAAYEPGDVMVIDPNAEGRFVKASEPYSTSVMGIYSTKPGVVGRRQKSDRSHMREEVPMAMVGVVPTKVSAENGAIKPGDLLVTSSMVGYAMKGTDRSLLAGAVVGKALGHLDAGTGLIEVAVSLQ